MVNRHRRRNIGVVDAFAACWELPDQLAETLGNCLCFVLEVRLHHRNVSQQHLSV